MAGGELQIDESRQKRIPPLRVRLKNALLCAGLGFIVINFIAFWMFPGLGLAGIYTIQHSYFNIITNLIRIYIVAFLVICAILGWFQGEYFISRFKHSVHYWKFW